MILSDRIVKIGLRSQPRSSSDDLEVGVEERDLQEAFEYLTTQVTLAIEAIKNDTTLSRKGKASRIKKKLEGIRDAALGLKLIFIELDNEDDAYVVFETLNTRGKDLRVSDLVKNHLAKHLKKTNRGVDIARDRWTALVKLLEASHGRIGVDAFIHHHWLSHHDYVTEKKLFKAIKSRISKAKAKPYLDQLGGEARLYRAIHEPDWRKWTKPEIEVRASLTAINAFHVRQALPFVLAVLSEYDNGTIKLKHARAALWAVEAFHFVATAVCSQPSSGGVSFMYASHARALRAGNDIQEKVLEIDQLGTKLRSRCPKKAEFIAAFAELWLTDDRSKQRGLVRYALRKITEFQTKGVPLKVDELSIEHLAPQRPKSGKAMQHVGQLGNLLLVDSATNDKLANKPFNEKQRILSKANMLRIDDAILTAKQWSNREIGARTKTLAELSYDKVWRF